MLTENRLLTGTASNPWAFSPHLPETNKTRQVIQTFSSLFKSLISSHWKNKRKAEATYLLQT